MKTKILSLFLLFYLNINFLHSQFHLNGTAVPFSNNCFRLTEAIDGQTGSVWSQKKINLKESFEVVADIFLGCANNGADGFVFCFQPVSTSLGDGSSFSGGGGLGYLGITPSLAIEFDVFKNNNYNDPSYDHMALLKNGNLSHSSSDNLFGPVKIIENQNDLEDCSYHELHVSWDAELLSLKIFIDCDLRMSYNGDVVNDIFGGDPNVYWGCTASTGAGNNEFRVCFDYTTFLDGMPDVSLCPGGKIQLNSSGGLLYHWTPSEGLSANDIPNPIASPKVTTNYVVEIVSSCGRILYDEINVTVGGEAISVDIGTDTMLCEHEELFFDASIPNIGATYLWSDGSTSSILNVTNSGTYTVTVTNIDCITTDRISVDFILFPDFNFGADTTLCLGEKIILNASSDRSTYLWQDQTYFPTYVVIEPGMYSVHVENDCASKEENIEIKYEDCFEIYIPNAFSPNGDLMNDVFIIYAGNDVQIIHNLYIFDRWGNTLFSAFNFLPNDERFGWTGEFNGKSLPNGVYAYTLKVFFKNGEQKIITGDVSLFR